MRRLFLAFVFLLWIGDTTFAQFVVHDPAVTARNTVTATIKEWLVNLEVEQSRRLRRMARRLSAFTDLSKYGLPEPPRWRHHQFEDADAVLFARDYHAALNYGDPSGAAYLAVSQPVVAAQDVLDGLDAHALLALLPRLATIDLADATTIAATNDTGKLRYNGRNDLSAISTLEAHVIDPSQAQSTTAVLDKISGAVLIGARQRQARIQLLTGMVEQLLVESKRARDTETAALNMQLATWRDARTANAAFAAGTGDALRNWRQP